MSTTFYIVKHHVPRGTLTGAARSPACYARFLPPPGIRPPGKKHLSSALLALIQPNHCHMGQNQNDGSNHHYHTQHRLTSCQSALLKQVDIVHSETGHLARFATRLEISPTHPAPLLPHLVLLASAIHLHSSLAHACGPFGASTGAELGAGLPTASPGEETGPPAPACGATGSKPS